MYSSQDLKWSRPNRFIVRHISLPLTRCLTRTSCGTAGFRLSKGEVYLRTCSNLLGLNQLGLDIVVLSKFDYRYTANPRVIRLDLSRVTIYPHFRVNIGLKHFDHNWAWYVNYTTCNSYLAYAHVMNRHSDNPPDYISLTPDYISPTPDNYYSIRTDWTDTGLLLDS